MRTGRDVGGTVTCTDTESVKENSNPAAFKVGTHASKTIGSQRSDRPDSPDLAETVFAEYI